MNTGNLDRDRDSSRPGECGAYGSDLPPVEGGAERSFLSVLPAAAAKPVSTLPQHGARRAGKLTTEAYAQGIRQGDRGVLARAITLVESSSREHQLQAQSLLQQLLPDTGKARRVGITGVPGVGKSTFIEAFGCWLCSRGMKVAVLAVDPSSTRTGGSILGDKTRMEQLCRQPLAFIRPSPAGSALGGVARKTRETLLLCEAAGFDVVLVETVGVGQSEVAVRSMVDFFLLLILPGAGDELQGIKRGIMEQADAVVVTKADGTNRVRAEQARQEYATALHYLEPPTPGWSTPAFLSSAITGEGIEEFWNTLDQYYEKLGASGHIAARRRRQTLDWLHQMVREELESRFYGIPGVASARAEAETALMRGEITAPQAARMLLTAADEPMAGSEGRLHPRPSTHSAR